MNNSNRLYDPSSTYSIETYAKQLQSKSLKKALSLEEDRVSYKNNKGQLGQLVEELYFGYKINSRKEADFKEAGVELKVCPLKKIKSKPSSNSLREVKGFSAKERIILSIINYMEIHEETWDNNSLFEKARLLLLMFYIYEKDKSKYDYVFELVSLWQPSPKDLVIIEKDWNLIISKIKEGRAHELSEGDTMYLGACTKGSSSKSVRQQPFADIPAKQRAFSLKRSYVDSIIEELLLKQKYTKKRVKSIMDYDTKTGFDEIILEKFKRLIGKNVEEIMSANSINRERKAKQFLRLVIDDLCKVFFGEKLEKLSEFKKANIELKTIVLKPNDIPKESMSFEQIHYCEIVDEDWEQSTIRDKFENKKHLWIIFKSDITFDKQNEVPLDKLKLYKVMFWNMPMIDLEGLMYELWKDTTDKIRKGIYDNFIKITENSVGHIRPKATNSKDLMLTPQGTYEKKKCFWLNAKYVAEQIEKES